MEFSVANNVTVRGHPSLFQANSNTLLEMHTIECARYIKDVVDRNPCVELEEEYADYAIIEGCPSRPEESEPAYSGADLLPFSRAIETGQADCRECQDFTESLELHLRTHSPAFESANGVDRNRTWNALIDFIDDKGFLSETPECVARSIGCGTQEVVELLRSMKLVEPGGIGSLDLADFLRFQRRASGCDVDDALAAVLEHLDELAAGGSSRLGRKLGLSESCVGEALDIIRKMRPYPTWGLISTVSTASVLAERASPDLVYYKRSNGDRILGVVQPGVKLNMLPGRTPDERLLDEQQGEKLGQWSARLRELEREALELAGLIERRKRTIVRVASFIVGKQGGYLDGETEHKEPLTVSQTARELGMPVSTASRAIKNITISTPRGTSLLRELLSRPVPVKRGPDVSSDYVLGRIKEHARRPDGRPRSDLEISNILESEGIDIARRTVNKYRRQRLN